MPWSRVPLISFHIINKLYNIYVYLTLYITKQARIQHKSKPWKVDDEPAEAHKKKA